MAESDSCQNDRQNEFSFTEQNISGVNANDSLAGLLEVMRARDIQFQGLLDHLMKNNVQAERPRVPFSEIGSQIPKFDPSEEESMTVESWLTRIDDIQALYDLSNEAVKILATNRLEGNAKKWYNSTPDIHLKTWSEIKINLYDLFGETVDEVKIIEKIRSLKWKTGDNFEDYFHKKIQLASKISMKEAEIIHHIIRGIENFTIRTQMITARFESLKELLCTMKLVARECDNRSVPNPKNTPRKVQSTETPTTSQTPSPRPREIICFKCKNTGHMARQCPNRSNTANSSSTPERRTSEVNEIMATESMFRRKVEIEGKSVLVLLDTGARCNLVRQSIADKFQNVIFPADVVLTGLNQSKVVCNSKTNFQIDIDGSCYDISAVIVPDDAIKYDLLLGEEFFKLVNLNFVNGSLNISKRYEPETNELSEILNINYYSEEDYCDLNIGDIDIEHSRQIHNLVRDAISKSANPEVTDDLPKMKIVLSNDRPISSAPRRLSYLEKQFVDSKIDSMIRDGIIRPSNSDYSSPVVLPQKKNGDYRLCVDYRALNKVTVKDKFPLPHIDDLITNLSGKSYFTALDLKSGFHHVLLDEESIKYTSFVVPSGQYEFLRMPFGLANGPAVFQRFVTKIFNKMIREGKIMIYMDDILIASDTIDENIQILREVLLLMSKYGLSLRLDKCKFAMTQLEYLGYKISKNKIQPGTDKTKSVEEFPEPRSVHEVRRFLGLTGYFRRFIPSYACIAKPLSDLLKKDSQFVMGEKQLKSFHELRQSLIKEPVLAIYNRCHETELHTDASTSGLGAILLQKGDDGYFHPIHYASWKTSPEESRYTSFKLETLAVVKAVEKFRVYLLGLTFKIFTDCTAVKHTLAKKDANRQIFGWCMRLEEFDYSIEHRHGRQMSHVDSLSRCYTYVVEESKNEVHDKLLILQDSDEEIRTIKQRLERNDSKVDKDYQITNGKLIKRAEVQSSLNRTIQHSTRKTPSELFLGYELRRNHLDAVDEVLREEQKVQEFIDQRNQARDEASHAIKSSQEKNEKRYNSKVRKPTKFHEGQHVAIKRVNAPTDRAPKMGSKYIGPYLIISVSDNDRYVVGDVPGHQVSQKPYRAVLPPERMKPWAHGYSPGEEDTESANDEAEVPSDVEDDVPVRRADFNQSRDFPAGSRGELLSFQNRPPGVLT